MSARGRTAWRFALLAVAAVAASATGCSSEAETFSLRLTWVQGGAQACPRGAGDVATCSTIPMSCDARALVRIVPLDDGVPYYTRCFRLTGATDACALGQLDLEASAPIPNTMVRVQVSVWSDEQLLGRGLALDECPEATQFDEIGQPQLHITEPALVPALGGEIYFPVGDRRVAEVELGCPRHDQLDLESCRLGLPVVEATIRDPLSWASVPAELAEKIEVRFGAAKPDGEGGWNLGADLEVLEASDGGELLWSKHLEAEPPALGCLEVLLRESRLTLTAICHDTLIANGTIDVDGFVVRKTLIDQILSALDLPDVPRQGLVLGVVVDGRTNQRIEGARVVVSSGTLSYPTADFQHVGLDSTSTSGLFLSTDAPYDSVWAGVHPSGVGDDGSARGGVIADHLTVVVIRMNTPIGGAR